MGWRSHAESHGSQGYNFLLNGKQSKDVYRRIIADDGEGMIADEVRELLTRLGAVERLLEQSKKILAWALRVQP